jgi:hypothetical protein
MQTNQNNTPPNQLNGQAFLTNYYTTKDNGSEFAFQRAYDTRKPTPNWGDRQIPTTKIKKHFSLIVHNCTQPY